MAFTSSLHFLGGGLLVFVATVVGFRPGAVKPANAAVSQSGGRSDRAGMSRQRSSEEKSVAGVPVFNYHLVSGGAHGLEGTYSAGFGELAATQQEWVVVGKPGTTTGELSRICKASRNGCNLVGNPSKGGVPFVEMRGTEGDMENVIILAAGAVRYIEPDARLRLIPETDVVIEAATPTTWGLRRIGAHERGRFSGNGATVFVFDTGVRTTHMEFNGRAVSALDMTSDPPVECNGDSNCARDVNGHGTHCAGSAAGETVGVAPSASVRSIQVLDDTGAGAFSWTYSALDWLATNDQRPAVGSMSLGGPVTQAMQTAVDAAVSSGVAIVVAAGNNNRDACQYSPAFVPSAITVGSIDEFDVRSYFSNYGSCTNIWAPGSSVKSAGVATDSAYRWLSGTSMAAPHVSGAVALLQGEYPPLRPHDALTWLTAVAERDAILDLKTGDVNLLLNVRESGVVPAPQPGTWKIFGAGCQMEANCIFSKNYPFYFYGATDWCSVRIYGHIPIPIRVDAFNTVRNLGMLSVGGFDFSGVSGPPSCNYTGVIGWRSEKRSFLVHTDASTGWKMCRTDVADVPTPAPQQGTWELYGTGCQMKANCIFTKGYPYHSYGTNVWCSILLYGSIPLRIDAFNTEKGRDVLRVGGLSYSGESGPPNGSYSEPIRWGSDHLIVRSGWQICRTDHADAPAPEPGSWELYGTGCQMEANCIFSNSFPQNYGTKETCTVVLYGDIPLRTDAFNTEKRFDFLMVGGKKYSGTRRPPDDTYTGTITWTSDVLGVATGWKMCRTDQDDAPGPAPGSWELYGTGCQMEGNCISSNNHPQNYGVGESCAVRLYDIPLRTVAFETEEKWDFLIVGGKKYSGTRRPPEDNYTGYITWTSDENTVATGWKMCRTDQA